MKRLWPKTLGAQLALLLLLALIVGQVLTFVILADSRRSAIIAANRAQVLSRTVTLVRLLRALPPPLHGAALEASDGRGFEVSLGPRSLVTDEDETAPNPFERRLGRMLAGADIGRIEVALAEHGPRRHGGWRPGLAIAIELGPGRWLNLEYRLAPPPGGWLLPTLTYFGVTAALVSLIAVLVARRIAAPLKALAGAADRLGRGEAVGDLDEGGPDELRRTARAFNRMQARLRRFVGERTRMLAAMSHDLRTPITALRLRAELLDEGAERGRFIATLDEMAAMVEASLAFAREDARGEATRPVDLGALGESVAEDLRDLGASIEAHDLPRRVLAVRPQALRRALRNVLENAVRYGGHAALRLEEDGQSLRFVVEDDGPGIPEDAIERVFEPFVRLETSRSRETGGIGLGLAIARDVLRAHGGDVTLANRPTGGLIVRLSLPKA